MGRLSIDAYTEKKTHILKIGMDLLMSKGYHATGIKEISEACTMPKGSFFNYFKSKEEFAIQVINNASEMLSTRFAKILLEEETNVKDQIVKLYQFRINLIINEFKFAKGCLLNGMSQELADHSEGVAEASREGLEKIYNLIENALEMAKNNGEVSFEESSREMALYIENSYRGAMLVSKALKTKEALNSFYHILINKLLI